MAEKLIVIGGTAAGLSAASKAKRIKPDLEIELDEALKNKNIYKITDAEDNQIQAAIDLIGK